MTEHAKSGAGPRSAATRPAAQRFQAKLAVGERHDPMEREADAVAARVAAGQPAPAVSRMAAPERKPEAAARQGGPERKEPVQRAASEKREPEAPVQRASAPEKREPEIQRAAAPEKKDPAIQRAAPPEKKEPGVQRAATPDDRKPKEKVQRQADDVEEVQAKSATDAGASMGDVAQHAVDTRGPGRALDPGVRSKIESSLGADMGHVRVHDDPGAHAAASALNARAFTHGSDIWMGPGESASDVRLMAHEATHVVQQGGAVQRMVQRANGEGPDSPAADPRSLPEEVGQLQPDGETLMFSELKMPPFKMSDHPPPITRPKNYRRAEEENPARLQNTWKAAMAEASGSYVKPFLERQLRERIAGSRGSTVAIDPGAIYAFTSPIPGARRNRYVIGNLSTIVREFASPSWDQRGRSNFYHVDHIKELQLGGQDDLTNYRLLKGSINRASGFKILRNIRASVGSHLRALGKSTSNVEIDAVLANRRLQFRRAEPDTSFSPSTVSEDLDMWTQRDVGSGNHFKVAGINELISVAPLAELGTRDRILVFPQETGWIPKQFNNRSAFGSGEKAWFRPWEITEKIIGPVEDENVLTGFRIKLDERGYPPRARIRYKRQPLKPVMLRRFPGGSRYAGFIDRPSIQSEAERDLGIQDASPIRLDEFEIDPDQGIVARGKLLPTIPLFENLEIDLTLVDGDLTASKTFATGEFRVPPPLQVNDSSLTLFVSTSRGLGVEGRVDFGIDGVGEGFLGASASTSEGFALDGQFRFDTQTFEPAEISMSYRDGLIRANGTIGIPDGKVSGVKRAQVSVTIESGPEGTSFAGDGTLEPKVRAIREGTVRFSHSAERGTEIGGTLTLSDDIPNVQGGSVEAVLSRPADQPEWDLRASGTVTAGVAGFTATVNVDYHNGMFTVEGEGAYSRGMLSGTVTVGATNRALGEDGRPTETIGDRIIAYGGGTVTVRIAPWLQGTVGVRFLPNGEIEVVGEIALPSEIEIFARKQIEKSIFSIAVQAPIFPGIVAEIGGGLSAQAGIGPGVIDQLRLGITYNPAHEEQTHVTGDAHLNIPADAGLRLAVRAGIGLGITGASATGGLEIGGMLGLAGAAEAGVHVDWMPTTGLRIDAFGALHAEPKFRFDISGYVSVRALGFEVYGNTWEFASYEFGSNLRFGVRFPIHYVEGEPFDISLSDVEFTVPEINPRQLLTSLVDRIV